MPIRFEILGPEGQLVSSMDTSKRKVLVGRALSANLRLEDATVSPMHALIQQTGEKILLTDLSSAEGTFVNDVRSTEAILVKGDTIRVGRCRFRIVDAPVVEIDERRSAGKDRRVRDFFPEENRLEERRQGDRRYGHVAQDPERRVGERRRGDRRKFDLTALDRRVSDRRIADTDELSGLALDRCFETALHSHELEVTSLWGDNVLDVCNVSDERQFTVGESPASDQVIPSVGIPDEFSLLRMEEGRALLAFTGEMSGTVRTRDKLFSLKALQQEKFVEQTEDHFQVSLGKDDFAKVAIGDIHFFITYIEPAPRIKRPKWFESDPALTRAFVGSALFFLLMVASLGFVKKLVPLTVEEFREPERVVRIKLNRPLVHGSGGSGALEGASPRARGREGRRGRKDAPPAKTSFGANVLDKLRSEIDQLTAPVTYEKFGRATGVSGRRAEVSEGTSALGVKGFETGGGGNDTIRISGPETGSGKGSRNRGGYDLSGTDSSSGGTPGNSRVDVVSSKVQVLSGLSAEVINSVVMAHRGQIRTCYEASLRRRPGSRGKLTLAFTISAVGKVSSALAKENTLADSQLEKCILAFVFQWQFPTAEIPGATEVTAYPFYFNPAN